MRNSNFGTVVFVLSCVLSFGVFAQTGRWSNQVSITVEGDYRYITSNGIPNHRTGQFPNRNNPNTIAPQQHAFKVPVKPRQASSTTPLGMWPFGVATNGIPFDPGAMKFYKGDRNSDWQYEAMSGRINLGLDMNNAHVQPGGAYHYHGLPPFTLPSNGAINQMIVAGYAADGFPISVKFGDGDPKDMRSSLRPMRSSYQLKSGMRAGGPAGRYDGTFIQDYTYVKGSGDLDECNGRFGVTPQHPEGIYHYFLTENYPFIPRFFRGKPDMSFVRRGPPPGGRGGPGGRRPPPPRGGGFPPPPPR
jgi:hypothetical protein